MAEDSLKKDLDWIKKRYGEKMMHMSRSLFPQILEVPGALPKILDEHFTKSRYLVDDIQSAGREGDFKALIFNYFDNGERRKFETNKSAVELMDEAGYILYPECKKEEDIQAFKKYYKQNEELCTFKGNRLESCRVWFATKKDVDNIKREDFTKPQREDDYGTSVISIQFSKGEYSTLSIKNRYNHTVVNPDNTFYSNLDNIKSGLTSAFENDYGVKEHKLNTNIVDFELDDYERVKGKYYHYNNEINNIYYCDNNVVINLSSVRQLNSDSQLLMDYFLVDLKNKFISLYDMKIKDGFLDTLGEIKDIKKQGNTLTISVKDGEDIVIGLNDRNQMISLYDPNVKECGDKYLRFNTHLEELNLPNIKKCGDCLLDRNRTLKKLNTPNLEEAGEMFLYYNNSLQEINASKLKSFGTCCLWFLGDELDIPNKESKDYVKNIQEKLNEKYNDKAKQPGE